MKFKLFTALAVALSTFAVAAPSTAQAQELRPIMVRNACYKQVRLWIHHADAWRNWHPHGSFLINGNAAATYLTASGVRLMQMTDHDLYFYAEATDGSGTWDGDHTVTVRGVDLPMKPAKYELKYASYYIELTCN